MAEGKKKSGKAASDEPAGVNPQAVYVGGESIADRILPHLKKILIGVIALAVVISAFFAYRYYQKSKAEKATDAVLTAMEEGKRDIEATPAPEPEPGDDENVEVTYASRAERAEAVLAAMAKAKGDPRTGVALYEAAQLLEAGRLDEAAAAYGKLATRAGLEGVLAREGQGFVAEARPDLDAALEAFRAMQTDDAGPRRSFALYHEGRILAMQKKTDEARTVLETALDKAKETGDSGLAELIEARLIQLDTPPLAKPEPKPEPKPEAPEAPKP
jgi:hypothetical protein